MNEQSKENNNVVLIGEVDSKLEISHTVYGENFYNFFIKVQRLSDIFDIIPVTVSERLLSNIEIKIESIIEVEGQIRSYNNINNSGNKLVLTLFARKIFVQDNFDKSKNPNQVFLNGFICKPPVFRTTPFGREIADILIAVNRSYNKSDYIPCIAWGRNARFSENLKIGDNIKIFGRIQSREYQKKVETGEVLNKTAYEVSISKMEI